MPDAEVYAKLVKLVSSHLRVDAASVNRSTCATDVPGWNSITHTLLLMQIEREFHIRLG